jgi:surface polysaccharide O-acyltransferase-like enzyme
MSFTTTTYATGHPTRTRAGSRMSYGTEISRFLVAAFTLSVVHTCYAWFSGLQDDRFTINTPVAWVFYAVGFASAFLARRDARWAQWTMLAYLAVLLYVSVFFYPTTFVAKQQTTFGWFENDVYTGLLMIAFYLVVLRLRGIALVARPRD